MPGLVDATPFSVNTVGAQAISRTYTMNVPLLVQPQTAIRFKVNGQIVQGGAAQNITFLIVPVLGYQANLFPQIAIPAAAFAINTTYDYELEMEATSRGPAGNGIDITFFAKSKCLFVKDLTAGAPSLLTNDQQGWNVHALNQYDSGANLLTAQQFNAQVSIGLAGPTVTGLSSIYEVLPYGG